jgi:hypothetical protein
MNRLPSRAPENTVTFGSFRIFFENSRRYSQEDAQLLSTIPVANFATGTAGVADTGDKFPPGPLLIQVANNGNNSDY